MSEEMKYILRDNILFAINLLSSFKLITNENLYFLCDTKFERMLDKVTMLPICIMMLTYPWSSKKKKKVVMNYCDHAEIEREIYLCANEWQQERLFFNYINHPKVDVEKLLIFKKDWM